MREKFRLNKILMLLLTFTPATALAEDYLQELRQTTRDHQAEAREESRLRDQNPSDRRVRGARRRQARPSWWVFGGIDGGYSALTTSRLNENFRDGYQFGIRAVGSYYFESPWVTDISLGWVRTQIEEVLGRQAIAGLITRAGLAEISLRHRRGSNLQFGPTLGVMFGTDLSFAPDFNGQIKSSPLFVGAQVLYEIPQPSSAIRLGARASTDLTISDRQLYNIGLSFQYGIPLPHFWRSKDYQPSPRAAEEIEDPITITYDATSVQVELRSEFVNFETGKAEITPVFSRYLDDLAALLLRTRGEWSELTVEGHTDTRGGYLYNMKLSERRANSVAKAMVTRGVSPKKIFTAAYGYTRPLDDSNTEEAWARNRRVEIKFGGVRDPKSFAIQLQMLRP